MSVKQRRMSRASDSIGSKHRAMRGATLTAGILGRTLYLRARALAS